MSAIIVAQRLVTQEHAHKLSTNHIHDLKYLNMTQDVYVVVNNGMNNYSEYSRQLYQKHNIHYVENDRWSIGFGFEFGAWRCGISFMKALSLDAHVSNYYFLQDSVRLMRPLITYSMKYPMCFSFPRAYRETGKDRNNQLVGHRGNMTTLCYNLSTTHAAYWAFRGARRFSGCVGSNFAVNSSFLNDNIVQHDVLNVKVERKYDAQCTERLIGWYLGPRREQKLSHFFQKEWIGRK